MQIHKAIICLSLLLLTPFTLASKIPVEAFSQLPSVQKFSVSPSGNKIVYVRNTLEKGISFIVMIDMVTGDKRVLGMTDNHGEHFRWLRWANEDIILGGIIIKTIRNRKKIQETRLYKFYADGKSQSQSVYSNRIFKISRRETKPIIQDSVIDWLPDDPDHVLVQMKIHEKYYPSVFKLNVNDGSVDTIKKSNKKIDYWGTDQQHQVRLGIAVNLKAENQKVWLKSNVDNDWDLLWEFEINSINAVNPKGFDFDGNILYFTKYLDDRLALFSINLTTKAETLVFADPKYDVSGSLIYSPKTHDVVGFYHDALPSGRFYLDPSYKEEQGKIDSVLNKTTNYRISTSDDLNTYIVYADASDIPGTYYLGKKKTNQLSKLFSSYPNLDPVHMAGSKKVTYSTRDGTQIEAYLSVPKGVNKPIATIIHPHGGPGSRDYGLFDVWTEFFISRGYAVLRPNFRGSTGYGYKFAQAQNASWGMAMQDDITDGVKWLVDEKITDPDNVCIFGASYGGYAALMGAVKTPDLFQCAISFAGVTDLVAIRNEYRRTRRYQLVKKQLGDDDKLMDKYSPRYRVGDIKVPILLLHGDVDKVVDVEHSQWMAKELRKAKKVFKYFELPDGDHYLSIQENRTKVFQEVGVFLEKYLN